MIKTNETTITKDPSGKKMIVTRDFNAPVGKVWKAWTESSMLDKWWAPRPWRAETKSMDFKNGGQWLYSMVGPEGERHWCKVEYNTINPEKSFTCLDIFCDGNGVTIDEFPKMQWDVQFSSAEDGTQVKVTISFDSEADLEKIVEMGFKEGFTMAHGNLDEVLSE